MPSQWGYAAEPGDNRISATPEMMQLLRDEHDLVAEMIRGQLAAERDRYKEQRTAVNILRRWRSTLILCRTVDRGLRPFLSDLVGTKTAQGRLSPCGDLQGSHPRQRRPRIGRRIQNGIVADRPAGQDHHDRTAYARGRRLRRVLQRVKASHLSLISHPEEITRLIFEAAGQHAWRARLRRPVKASRKPAHAQQRSKLPVRRRLHGGKGAALGRDRPRLHANRRSTW
jgi:hypothetical protein